MKTYRDDDINVHAHHVKTKDSRINVFKPYDHYDYLSYSMGPQWIGKAAISEYEMEREDEFTGRPIRYKERSQVLFGMYFFLFPENYDHVRRVDNIENLIAYLGGLTEILIVAFIGMTTVFNQQSIVGKYLRKLYITPIK